MRSQHNTLGPTPTKQFKNAIIDGDEDRAISIYTTKENDRALADELNPSVPFPTKKSTDAEIPLHLTARSGFLKLLTLLLENGADPSTINSRKETCLHCLCSLPNNPEDRAIMLDTIVHWVGVNKDGTAMDKVSVNQVDVDGSTAIHYAAQNGLVSCVERLVQNGAIISIVNRQNSTCCELADEANHKTLASMLELALVFQPVDHSMQEFDNLTFPYDNVPGKLLVNAKSLTMGGLGSYMEDAIKIVTEAISAASNSSGGEVVEYHGATEHSTSTMIRARAEVLLNSNSWDVERLLRLYSVDAAAVLAKSKLEPITASDAATKVSSAGVENHQNTTDITEACAVCGENMLRPCDLKHFVSGKVLEPERRELRCLSNHAFCVECWSNHIKVQVIDSGLGYMPCLGFKCGEILEVEWAPVLLKSQEQVNRFLAQRQRHVVDCSTFKNCPTENCGLIVCVPCGSGTSESLDFAESAAAVSTASAIPSVAICGHGHSFCLSCMQAAHAPCTCADYTKWLQIVQEEVKDVKEGDGNGDDLANALWVAANTKRCPRCSTAIEKDEGCNHMCCRKCRKEFCWICMQDWSMHGDNTGGYFQCNRFVAQKEAAEGGAGADSDMFADERGNAHAETIRLRQRGRRMARFIHYFTRYRAHGESVQMEAKMHQETLPRILHALRASKSGTMKWLQGSQSPNPLADAPSAGAVELEGVVLEEYTPSGSSTMKVSSDQPVPAGHSKLMKTASSDNINDLVSKHRYRSEECLQFLSNGFDELLKCRSLLQWSYPYAFFEFEEIDSQSSLSEYLHHRRGYHSLRRLEDHKITMEGLQADLESFVETLSDVVARRRLRAGQNQIINATRAARSKRIELEGHLLTYNISKNQQALFNTTTPASTHRHRHSSSSSRQRRVPRPGPLNAIDELDDIANLLFDLDAAMVMNETSNSNSATATSANAGETGESASQLTEENMTARRQQQLSEMQRRMESLFRPHDPNAEDDSRNDPVTPMPPPVPQTASSRSGGSSASRSRRRRNREPTDSNRTLAEERLTRWQQPPRPPSSTQTPQVPSGGNEPEYATLSANDAGIASEQADGGTIAAPGGVVADGAEEDEDEEVFDAIDNLIYSPSTGSRSPTRSSRNPAANLNEFAISELSRRAAAERELNQAILMSLQESVPVVEDPSIVPRAEDIELLTAMGYTTEQATTALRHSRNNLEMAANYLLNL